MDSNPDAQDILALVFAAYAVLFGFFLLMAAAFYVIMALALSKLFAKVGIEPWIAWVPFYSTWKWLELGGFAGWISLLSLIPYGSIVTSVFLYIGMWSTGKAFRKDVGMLVLGILLPVVWLFVLGFGKDPYEPELIKAAGLTPPRVGRGAELPAGA